MSKPASAAATQTLKALEFDGQHSADLTDDWKIIVAFYTALHWVGAAMRCRWNKPIPTGHRETFVFLATSMYAVPDNVQSAYSRLFDLSHIARYSLDESKWIGEQDVLDAEKLLSRIRDWAMPQIPKELLE